MRFKDWASLECGLSPCFNCLVYFFIKKTDFHEILMQLLPCKHGLSFNSGG